LVAFGQTTPPPGGFGSTTLKADLSPLNVVPPIQDRAESGAADIEITLVQAVTGGAESAVVSFEISLANAQAGTFTGFAIHEGVAGENGSIVVEAQLSSDQQTPGSSISGQILVSDQTQLEALQAIVQNPEAFYVLLTATDNPAGLLRGQLSNGGDIGGEMDNLSDKIDRMQEQLNTIQRMVRSVGRVLGIDPQFLPEPPGDTATDGNGGDSVAPANP
jgi:hypothetical protein